MLTIVASFNHAYVNDFNRDVETLTVTTTQKLSAKLKLKVLNLISNIPNYQSGKLASWLCL